MVGSAVRSGLQSVTQHLPGPLARLGVLLLGQECYTTLVWNVDPTRACLRLALSKALGIGIIVFGSVLKIPQIYKIVRHSSARGVSLTMYSLEVVAYDISLAYAFRRRLPFSTYGENASLTLQNMLITLLILWYQPQRRQHGHGLLTTHVADPSRGPLRPVLLAAAAMVLASVFLFLVCPPGLLAVLQAFSIPISLVSKMPQIAELHRNKEPGQLSALVVFAQLLGTIARVFTTVVETGDWLLGMGFGLATVLNAVIAVQVRLDLPPLVPNLTRCRPPSAVRLVLERHPLV